MVRALDHQVNNGQQQEQLGDDHKRMNHNNNEGAGYLPIPIPLPMFSSSSNNSSLSFECSDNWQISSPYASFSPPFMETGVIKCSISGSAESSSSDGDLGSQGL